MSDLPVSRTDYDLLKAALEPFARYLTPEMSHRPDSAILHAIDRDHLLRAGDFRAAAEAYNQQPVRVVMRKREAA